MSPERVRKVFEQWCGVVMAGTESSKLNVLGLAHCPALLHTSVLDGTFPVHFSLPTHISPFLNLFITTGTLSSSQLLIGINTVALIS